MQIEKWAVKLKKTRFSTGLPPDTWGYFRFTLKVSGRQDDIPIVNSRFVPVFRSSP